MIFTPFKAAPGLTSVPLILLRLLRETPFLGGVGL